MDLVIQSVNFDKNSNTRSNLVDDKSAKNSTTRKTTDTASNNNGQSAGRRQVNANKSNTPLLDNIQADQTDSDHE